MQSIVAESFVSQSSLGAHVTARKYNHDFSGGAAWFFRPEHSHENPERSRKLAFGPAAGTVHGFQPCQSACPRAYNAGRNLGADMMRPEGGGQGCADQQTAG